jgi:hypothetical protein
LAFKSFCHKGIDVSMHAEPTDKTELLRLVMNLNSSKSPGPDNIRPGLIKDNITAVMEPLLYIYNLSISTGIVPEKLQTAEVVPIYKKVIEV